MSGEPEEMTGETVKAVASEFLARAEKEHEEKLSHQITRHGLTPTAFWAMAEEFGLEPMDFLEE